MGRDSHVEPVESPNDKRKAVLEQAKPWEQQPGEGLRAYTGFRCFMTLPVGTRSVEKVAAEIGVHVKSAKQWQRDWRWSGRLVAYERHLVALHESATERQMTVAAVDWAKRAGEIRELEFAAAKEGLEICRRMINKIGKALSHRKTVSINQIRNVAVLLDIASKVGRLSSGLDTERTANSTEITGPGGGALQVSVAAAIAKVYGIQQPAAGVVGPGNQPETKAIDVGSAGNPVDLEKSDTGIPITQPDNGLEP